MTTMRRFSWRQVGLIAVAVIAAVLLSMAKAENKGNEAEGQPKMEKTDTPAETGQVLDFLVINKQTKEPIAGIELDIRINRKESKDVTDKYGQCRIEFGKEQPDYISITASKEGFVPIRATWRPAEARIQIPDEYTLALEPGTSIGGIIQDEDGKPIEGVNLYLLVPGGGEIERVSIWEHEERTDANGRWRCDIMPAKLDDIWIRLAHPDYISDEMYGKTPKPSIEKLRNMTGVMVMKKGLTVTGRVLDLDGQPIKAASVAQGSDRHGSHYPSTKSDSEGQFKFGNARPAEMVLTVQAKGHSPDLKQITVRKGIEPVEFCLEPGHTIRGRIVDPAGNPIAGAFVAADTWRGHRSLRWRVDTDAEGRFQWDDAPADEVLIDMGKQRYMSVRNYRMSASDKGYLITMYPELRINGAVVDAETGEPINSFKLLPGIDWGSNRPITWERRRAKTFTKGRYEATFTYPRHAHLIRVEADRYEPGISRPFKSDEGEVVFDFELKKGTGPTGIVLLPDGSFAVGAEVILCTPSQGAYIRNGRNEQKHDSLFVETKQDGRFSFPAQTDVYSIVALHDKGYAEVKGEALTVSSQVTLQPWACVEGKLLIGKEPGANEVMRVLFETPYEPNSPRIYHDCRAITDSNGQFIFECIPPGQARVSREVRLSDRSSGYSHGILVEIKAGETISVTIGGTGRPVVGKVVAPADYKEPINWAYGHNSLSLKLPEYPGPDNIEQMSMEERRAWYESWRDSDESKTFIEEQRKQRRHYAVKIEHDGAFRVEDVPAGKYKLRIMMHEPPVGRQCGFGELIGSVDHEFDVSEMLGGRSDEPLDLGTLELMVKKRLRVGDVAPLFKVKTLDGKDLKLANFQGKVVLLDFWATWCVPCIADMPRLKDLYDAFSKDERFVMISLSMDRKVETAKEYVAKNKLKWLQSFLDGGFQSTVVKDYGVIGIPAKFLIGADGRIIAKILDAGQLKLAISKALKKKPEK